jgi:heme/copper-type cytochrome/quinol oxidase subunit 4
LYVSHSVIASPDTHFPSTAGPVILVGFILAIVAVKEAESGHFNDKHKLLGLIIVTMYCVQCSLGAFIHWVKNPNRKRRPPQNYLHAIFGIAIIALSFYQIHLGYDTEWPETTGRDDVPDGIGKLWVAWTIVSPAFILWLEKYT